MNEQDASFFRPLWRRIAITVVCACWTGFEYYHGDQFWILLSAAITVYAVWSFLIAFDRKPAG